MGDRPSSTRGALFEVEADVGQASAGRPSQLRGQRDFAIGPDADPGRKVDRAIPIHVESDEAMESVATFEIYETLFDAPREPSRDVDDLAFRSEDDLGSGALIGLARVDALVRECRRRDRYAAIPQPPSAPRRRRRLRARSGSRCEPPRPCQP